MAKSSAPRATGQNRQVMAIAFNAYPESSVFNAANERRAVQRLDKAGWMKVTYVGKFAGQQELRAKLTAKGKRELERSWGEEKKRGLSLAEEQKLRQEKRKKKDALAKQQNPSNPPAPKMKKKKARKKTRRGNGDVDSAIVWLHEDARYDPRTGERCVKYVAHGVTWKLGGTADDVKGAKKHAATMKSFGGDPVVFTKVYTFKSGSKWTIQSLRMQGMRDFRKKRPSLRGNGVTFDPPARAPSESKGVKKKKNNPHKKKTEKVCAADGYGFVLDGDPEKWRTLADDHWDIEIISGGPVTLLGKRRIDDAEVCVFERGSKVMAQTAMHVSKC